MRILIIGYGVVGHNMHKIFPDADIADPEKDYSVSIYKDYDIAFVCVPTPMVDSGKCDTSIVKKAIADHIEQVDTFCIRSTIPPGTTNELIDYFDYQNIVFSPEYFGETIHANGHDYNFMIFGGGRQATAKVIQAYKKVKHSSLHIYQTDSTTAELCKYMENCWLATKVTFCNEFARIADRIGVDYNELRELWLADPRINRSHTFVHEDQPYYDSKCLNKDIPALIEYAQSIGAPPRLMAAVETSNAIQKTNHMEKKQ